MGLLHRQRNEIQLVELEVLTVEGELRRCPEALDDPDALLETDLALGVIDVEASLLIAIRSTTKAHIQPSPAYGIHRCGVLRQTNGVVERRQQHRCPQANFCRLGGDMAREHQGGRPHAVAREVVFRYPRAAKSQLLAVRDLLGGLSKELGRFYALRPWHVGE